MGQYTRVGGVFTERDSQTNTPSLGTDTAFVATQCQPWVLEPVLVYHLSALLYASAIFYNMLTAHSICSPMSHKSGLLLQGVYQYVPAKGEGFPEDFIPFKQMDAMVNAKY